MLIIPNFKDVQRHLAGLQNQYTGYSYNIVGEASPNYSWSSYPHLPYRGPWFETAQIARM